MTQNKKSVREILEELRNKPPMDDLNPQAWEKVFINKARQQIIEAVMERLPKELKEDGELPTFFIEGHNQALVQTKKNLEEL